jgi:hypothetical protein
MAIRRMMIFALCGNLVDKLIQDFKNFISNFTSTKDGITFEAESCLNTDLTVLNNLNLLSSANFILTPNSSSEGLVVPVTPLPSIDFRNLLWRTEGKTTSWNLSATTGVVDTSINDPLGGLNTLRITETATNAAHTFNQSVQNYRAQQGTRFTLSSYLRKGNGASAPDIIQLSYGNSYANFNVTSGTVTGSGSILSSSTVDAGSGWWRCIITGNTTASSATNNPQVFIGFVNNNPTATLRPNYLGATDRNMFVFGTQFELSNTVSAYQKNDLYPQTTNGLGLLLNASVTPYRVNSSGELQNIPIENLIYPSVGIGSVASGTTWRWIRNGLADTTSGLVAPDGTFTASRINLGAGTTRPDYYLSYQTSGNAPGAVSFPIPKIRTLILFVKQDSTDRYLGIRLNTGGNTGVYNTNSATIKIDCSNGTLANNPTDYTITYSSQAVGSGWYKVCINRTTAWDSMLFQSSVTLNTVNNTAGAGVLIWGVQVVDGTVDINTSIYNREIGYSISRLDYSVGSCPDYLLERSMFNTILQSENFTAANWVKTNATATTSTFISPDNNSYSNVLAATSNNASIKQAGSSNGTIISARIFSVYLRRKTGSGTITLSMGATTAVATLSPSSWNRYFVVDTPLSGTYTVTSGSYTVTTSSNHGFETGDAIIFDATSGSGADASITSITVTSPTVFTFTNGTATSSGNCTIYSNNAKILISTSGDEVYAWGAQIEASNLFTTSLGRIPTSYIPTTTAQVTRNADALITNFSGSSACSLLLELSKIGGSNNVGLNFIFIGNETSYGVATDGFGFASNSATAITFSKKENNGSIVTVATFQYIPVENTKFKILLTLSGTTLRAWVDGSLMATTTFANPNSLKHLVFDPGNGSANLRLAQSVSWPTVLNRDSIDLLFAYPYYNAGYTPTNNELQQIINRAYAESFTIPSITILGHCDTLITAMKANGVWDVSDVYFNFAYNDVTLTDWARINWKNPYGGLGIANVVGGITYQTNGFKSAGTGGYIDTRFIMSQTAFNFTLNNAGSMIVQSQIGSSLDNSSNYVYEGSTFFALRASGVSPLVAINSSFFQFPSATGNRTVGLKALMRDSSTAVRMFANLTNYTHTQASTALSSGNHFLFSTNNPGNDSCVATHWLGASLTNTQITNFRTAYNTYLSSIGLTPFA